MQLTWQSSLLPSSKITNLKENKLQTATALVTTGRIATKNKSFNYTCQVVLIAPI